MGRKEQRAGRRTPIWGYCTKAEADAIMREAIRLKVSVSNFVRGAVLSALYKRDKPAAGM